MRTVRTSRSTATAYCAQSRTGFTDVTFEDRYDFYAQTAGKQGAISTALGKKTASTHACFGKDI